ncbi:hypothetical protein DPMN_132734 [Dreissena polymorpha]|uniref:Uncharacterized protein n=1 Tax=Dreissena polymorpha TaxID=45954 RepID=A0A9D4FVN6_DREPO|nr:hypothetical protein DPMN_132734 [Dreissena polymorpha]
MGVVHIYVTREVPMAIVVINGLLKHQNLKEAAFNMSCPDSFGRVTFSLGIS